MKLIDFYTCKTILYQIVNTYIKIISIEPTAYEKWIDPSVSLWAKAKRKYLSQTLKKLYIDTKKVKFMKVIGPVHQDGLNIDMYCFIVITTNDIYATIGVEANTNTVIAISLKPYKISLWERFMFKIGYKSKIQLY